MKPLNPGGITWLVGAPAEIEQVLHNEKVLSLGHVDDVRSLLIPVVTNENLLEMKPYIGKENPPDAAFVLAQGSVLGLLVERTPKPK